MSGLRIKQRPMTHHQDRMPSAQLASKSVTRLAGNFFWSISQVRSVLPIVSRIIDREDLRELKLTSLYSLWRSASGLWILRVIIFLSGLPNSLWFWGTRLWPRISRRSLWLPVSTLARNLRTTQSTPWDTLSVWNRTKVQHTRTQTPSASYHSISKTMPNRKLSLLQVRLTSQSLNQHLRFPSRNLHSQRKLKSVEVGETTQVELVQIRIRTAQMASPWLATSQTADSSQFPKNLLHTSKRCPTAQVLLIVKWRKKKIGTT